jgi:hypothetical protein
VVAGGGVVLRRLSRRLPLQGGVVGGLILQLLQGRRTIRKEFGIRVAFVLLIWSRGFRGERREGGRVVDVWGRVVAGLRWDPFLLLGYAAVEGDTLASFLP